ncbi:MAG: type I phosphomannose isomerase catalytic subunit [Eubacteriales bacterium]
MSYPLILSHIYRERVWGGKRFSSSAPVGEDWVLSVREDAQSIVTNGIYAGKKLADIVGGFPLLIKFIDTAESLSVQVHPDEVAAALTGTEAKSEMWFILDCEPGACIYHGVKQNVSMEELRAVILSGGDPTPYLNKKPVASGDVYYIPGGTPHAIGAGIYLCEVQQNSDTTFRMYDYGRPRELHLYQAAMSVKNSPNTECPYFSYEPVEGECELSGLCILAVTWGKGVIGGYAVREGDCVYIPDGVENCRLSGDIKAIKITV